MYFICSVFFFFNSQKALLVDEIMLSVSLFRGRAETTTHPDTEEDTARVKKANATL